MRRALPHLRTEEAADLARIVDTLAHEFQPERIYVFGSQARGTAAWVSDVDLLVVVPELVEPSYRLSQRAIEAIDGHLLPLDLLFMARDDFAWRTEVPSSLPSTVVREGRTLYAA